MCFEPYLTVPKAAPIKASLDEVVRMAPHLSGGAGPSGINMCIRRIAGGNDILVGLALEYVAALGYVFIFDHAKPFCIR